MIVGIVGSRRRTRHEDYIKLYKEFEIIYCKYSDEIDLVISGGCATGADSWAEDIADRFKIPFNDEFYKPDFYGLKETDHKWKYTERYYTRNEKLAKDADILIACVSIDRTGGTENTIKYFKKHHPNGNIIYV